MVCGRGIRSGVVDHDANHLYLDRGEPVEGHLSIPAAGRTGADHEQHRSGRVGDDRRVGDRHHRRTIQHDHIEFVAESLDQLSQALAVQRVVCPRDVGS